MEMTTREFLNAVISTEAIAEDVKKKAIELVAKMDEKNAKRSRTQTKTQKANEPIIKEIKALLEESGTQMICSDIAKRMELTTQKVSALLKQIDGIVIEDVKVKGKGKVKGYSLPKVEA